MGKQVLPENPVDRRALALLVDLEGRSFAEENSLMEQVERLKQERETIRDIIWRIAGPVLQRQISWSSRAGVRVLDDGTILVSADELQLHTASENAKNKEEQSDSANLE